MNPDPIPGSQAVLKRPLSLCIIQFPNAAETADLPQRVGVWVNEIIFAKCLGALGKESLIHAAKNDYSNVNVISFFHKEK